MSAMFWVWIVVIVVSVVVEIVTTDLIAIWFTFGAIVPFILSATEVVDTEWQIVIFVVLSVILLASLRNVTKKFLLRNSNTKTNVDSLIGQKFRMIERTDFETVGRLKIKDVEWSAVGEGQATIEKGAVVEIVKISGNKLIVKEIEKQDTKKDSVEKEVKHKGEE